MSCHQRRRRKDWKLHSIFSIEPDASKATTLWLKTLKYNYRDSYNYDFWQRLSSVDLIQKGKIQRIHDPERCSTCGGNGRIRPVIEIPRGTGYLLTATGSLTVSSERQSWSFGRCCDSSETERAAKSDPLETGGSRGELDEIQRVLSRVTGGWGYACHTHDIAADSSYGAVFAWATLDPTSEQFWRAGVRVRLLDTSARSQGEDVSFLPTMRSYDQNLRPGD